MAILSIIFSFFGDDFIANACRTLFFLALCFYPAFFFLEVSVGLGLAYLVFIALWIAAFFFMAKRKG